jgi:hypothetical protein
MIQASRIKTAPQILILNDGFLWILPLSEIKMFHGIFTIIILSMSNQVPVTTINYFMLSHRFAMRASIGIQYSIRMYFTMLTVISYKTTVRYITQSVWLRHHILIQR